MRASRAAQKTEASAEHTYPFCARTETTQQDSSPRQRGKYVKFTQDQALMQNMYRLSSQTLPPERKSPEESNFCIPHATPRHRIRDCQITNTEAENVSTVEPIIAPKESQHLPKNLCAVCCVLCVVCCVLCAVCCVCMRVVCCVVCCGVLCVVCCGVLLCVCVVVVVWLLWCCCGGVVLLLWCCCGVVVVLLWCCCGVVVVLLWCCCGVVVLFL